VRDLVVAGELPQGLTGRAAPKQLRVGNEPSQSRPPHSKRRRLRRRGRVVVEGSREDHGVDQPGGVVERAQLGGLDHGLDAATFADDTGGGPIVPAVQIGAGARQPKLGKVRRQSSEPRQPRFGLVNRFRGARRPYARTARPPPKSYRPASRTDDRVRVAVCGQDPSSRVPPPSTREATCTPSSSR